MTESEKKAAARKWLRKGWEMPEALLKEREVRLRSLLDRWQARVDVLAKSSYTQHEETVLIEVIEEVNEILT